MPPALRQQRIFSSSAETMSAPPSTEFMASTTNVRTHALSPGLRTAWIRNNVLSHRCRACRQAPIQHQDLEDFHRLLQLPPRSRAHRREDLLHARRALAGENHTRSRLDAVEEPARSSPASIPHSSHSLSPNLSDPPDHCAGPSAVCNS